MIVDMGRRIAIVMLATALALPHALAQPAGGGDIEMDPQEAGSGSGSGSGSAAAPTDAAPAAKDPKLAKKLVAAAQQLVQKGDYNTKKNKPDDAKAQYEQALTAYTKALEVTDDAGLLAIRYELGLLMEKLGKLDVAAQHMRAVSQAKTAVKPDIQKKATAKLDDLSTKIGFVTVTVNAEGATITRDGVELAKAPLTEPLIFMPGTYTLSFAADGYQPKDTELKVEAGSESERAIELEPIKIVVNPVKIEQEEPVKPVVVHQPSLLPVYIGGGAAVAFGVTGIVTGFLAVKQHSTYVAGDTGKLDREDAKSNGKSLAHVTDALFAGAVVAGGFTAYWYFFKYKPAKRKMAEDNGNPVRRDPNAPDISKLDVAPWVQPSAGGVSLSGSF
jgi:hypothetical protein